LTIAQNSLKNMGATEVAEAQRFYDVSTKINVNSIIYFFFQWFCRLANELDIPK